MSPIQALANQIIAEFVAIREGIAFTAIPMPYTAMRNYDLALLIANQQG